MKSDICDVCLNSGMLCASCQEKVDDGLVSKSELEILKSIRQEENENKSLKDANVRRVIETSKSIVLVSAKGDSSKIIGRGGSTVKKLVKRLNKNVKVVEESSDNREFLQSLIFPTPILSLNVVYSQGGEKYRMKIPGDGRLGMPKDAFLEIAQKLLGKSVDIEWDKTDRKEETIEDKIKKVMKKMESKN